MGQTPKISIGSGFVNGACRGGVGGRAIRVAPLRPGRACEHGDAIRHAKRAPVGHEPENSPPGGGSVMYCIDMSARGPPLPDPAP